MKTREQEKKKKSGEEQKRKETEVYSMPQEVREEVVVVLLLRLPEQVEAPHCASGRPSTLEQSAKCLLLAGVAGRGRGGEALHFTFTTHRCTSPLLPTQTSTAFSSSS